MGVEILAETQWQSRRLAHEQRVDSWLEPHLRRRGAGIAHPVDDFLFTYYSFRPAALRRWHPGLGVRLLGVGSDPVGATKGYVSGEGGAEVDPGLPRRRAEQVRWVRRLLAATADRPPMLACFGLHEWAMVYRQRPDALRHPTYPLRLGSDASDAVVEGHRVTCTHHDAFRFFTTDARPLNTVAPTRETQHELDQPGCLHATMDLYKWAYKLSPFTSAELVADCFALAREVRQVDMGAAPYDLSTLGVAPIPIETPAGKAEYVARQREFVARAAPLRARLVETCDLALRSADPEG